MKILIIEDEEAIRHSLRDLLEIHGHEVLVAEDGVAGLGKATAAPDLILCDINMPRMDGFRTLEEIRKLPACRETPFVFLTAMNDRSSQRKGMTLGADDYISKPFTEREVIDAIEARMSRQKTLRDRVEQLMAERRREISADWSHELMTPLNGVLGGLQLLELEGGQVSPAEMQELLGIIREGALRQQRLSRKLVLYYELARLRENPALLGNPRCDAARAVAEGVAGAEEDENAPGRVRVDCEPCELALSQRHLSEAVAKLTANALCFSPPDRQPLVNGRLNGGFYRIEILDEGPGMSPAQLAGLGAFVQFDRDQRQQGLGLGIAIARGVAELGGGRLELSPRDGGGLRALLEFPVAPARSA